MKLGIIGLPQAGKTTIYNALTRGNAPTTMSGKMEVHTAVVEVPDPRVDVLSKMFNPKKTMYARVIYADIAGLDGAKSGDISGKLINELGLMEGFILVVRCFEDGSVMHSQGGIDPKRDLEMMTSELILTDLIAVERRLEKLTDEAKKGGGRTKPEIERDQVLFEKMLESLNEEKPLRLLDLNAEDLKAISGFQFLTMKSMLIVLNLGEGQDAPDLTASSPYAPIIPLQGQVEMEIAQLEDEEAAIFLEEYGIEEPSLHRMIRESYTLMKLQSFFTVGEDEVRAWTVKIGASAPEAAGTIHSDLQKGFIRAEVVAYDDLIEAGSMAASRDVGKLRVEGKTYVVKDGEIVHIRFNV